MSNDLNQCQFIGRLGRDPEVRFLPNGNQVTNMSMACGQTWKDKNGDKQEKTEWVNVVFFGKLAEIAGQYLAKGKQVYISGRFSTRKWQDKDGNDRYNTEIVADRMQMLGSGDGGKPQDRTREAPRAAPKQEEDFDEDSIPF